MTFRILLFSMLAALLLYIPFYYFAPLYRSMYVHVPSSELTSWVQWAFVGGHNGIQIYIAYILLYLIIGLTVFFEYIYLKIISPRVRRMILAFSALGCFFYLRSIGFYPPMAAINVTEQGTTFIAICATIAFIFGDFFDRKEIKGLLVSLLFFICLVPTVLDTLPVDYFYVLSPALRTIKGCALNHSYFQYDQLLSFMGMIWLKFGLPLDRFHIVGDISYLAFFIGIYFMAKNLFFDKRFAIYFILSLVIIKVYGNIGDLTRCPQVGPIRLDMWLILLGLAYWKGPQHWIMGITLGILLIFHHAFGMIYSISYILLVLTLFAFNISKFQKQYLPNAIMMAGGMLINQIFISSNNTIPAMQYEKYNIGFMPIDPKSFFWYVPVVISTTFLLLWKNKSQLPQKYFQTGLFLVLLAIGNSLYFFGRSHENNLINIAASLWLTFFILIDLVVYKLPQQIAGVVKKIFTPMAGVFIVGMIAYFYSATAIDRINAQITNLPKMTDLFKADNKIDLDFKALRTATQGSPNIVFLSAYHDLEFYYYGDYTPADISPFHSQNFKLALIHDLNNKLSKGADIVIHRNEFEWAGEFVPQLHAKYTESIKDFVLISNNKPSI